MKKVLVLLTVILMVSACSAETEVEDTAVAENGEVLGEQVEPNEESEEVEEEVAEEPVEEEAAPAEEEPVQVEVPAAPVEVVVEETGDFTVNEVAGHSIKADCWTIINDKVYDLSAWLEPQPRGIFNLTEICGKDSTMEWGGPYLAGVRADSQFQAYYLGDI